MSEKQDTTFTEVRVDDALRHVARAALADDGLMVAHADHVLALLNERDRLRRGWLRVIQQENSCPATGGGCLAKRCACVAEMQMLMQEASDAG
jgi:hypothetical protein